MEQRQEIKDGVKQRLIEYMTEQITKEESFLELKSELIEELLAKKEIKKPTPTSYNPSFLSPIGPKNPDTFGLVSAKAESALEQLKEKQAERFKKLIDVKLGKGTNENVIKMIKNLHEENSESYSDLIDMLENKNIPDYAESFKDPLLKRDFDENAKQLYRESTMNVLKSILRNPINKDLDVFNIHSESNGNNYVKTYTVENKSENFVFKCTYNFHAATKHKFVTELYADSKGFKLFGEELGLPFAIQAMEIIDTAENLRQEAVKFVEKKTTKKRTTNLQKKVRAKKGK